MHGRYFVFVDHSPGVKETISTPCLEKPPPQKARRLALKDVIKVLESTVRYSETYLCGVNDLSTRCSLGGRRTWVPSLT
jgi:hypothetical protein